MCSSLHDRQQTSTTYTVIFRLERNHLLLDVISHQLQASDFGFAIIQLNLVVEALRANVAALLFFHRDFFAQRTTKIFGFRYLPRTTTIQQASLWSFVMFVNVTPELQIRINITHSHLLSNLKSYCASIHNALYKSICTRAIRVIEHRMSTDFEYLQISVVCRLESTLVQTKVIML